MERHSDVSARLDAIEEMLPELEATLVEIQKGDLGVVTKSNSFDLVTRADKTSEARLVAFAGEYFPDDLILAEEGNDTASADDAGERFLWILDSD